MKFVVVGTVMGLAYYGGLEAVNAHARWRGNIESRLTVVESRLATPRQLEAVRPQTRRVRR